MLPTTEVDAVVTRGGSRIVAAENELAGLS
jgi:hypothetical protein